MLTPSLAALNDSGGPRVPAGLPPVVGARVRIFPRTVWTAVWQWFDTHAWPIRCRFGSREILEFWLAGGGGHVAAPHCAQKPGIVSDLNRCAARSRRSFGDRVMHGSDLPGIP